VACLPCKGRLPACDRCGKVFIEGKQDALGKYCDSCYETAERCSCCDGVIMGRYYSIEGRGTFCHRCRKKYTPCDCCGFPVADGVRIKDRSGKRSLCRICFDTAERCYACGNPLTREFFSHSEWPDRKFCRSCEGYRKHCDFCSSPVGNRSYGYEDGRVSCADCHSTAVVAHKDITALEKKVRPIFSNRFSMKLRPAHECPVHLVSAGELSRIIGKKNTVGRGFTQRERGLFHAEQTRTLRGTEVVRQTENLAIYVENGLPHLEAISVLAHELAHLWQYDNLPKRDVDLRWKEGHSSWVQYHVLFSLADKRAVRLAARLTLVTDEIYGAGLQMMLNLERKHGFNSTIKAFLSMI